MDPPSDDGGTGAWWWFALRSGGGRGRLGGGTAAEILPRVVNSHFSLLNWQYVHHHRSSHSYSFFPYAFKIAVSVKFGSQLVTFPLESHVRFTFPFLKLAVV